MNQYLPFVLLAFVALTGVVGLTLSTSESTTANVVAERSCATENTPNWVNCLTPNGGCPAPEEDFAPYKQYAMVIGNIPTCCCAPLHTQERYHRIRSLYG
ncbi:hypothetical protein HY485_04070 [Candidatus Woesearchaeota archaeon]|nr:hypothetical protein [Candidatus Woesearchaeota archaeon]